MVEIKAQIIQANFIHVHYYIKRQHNLSQDQTNQKLWCKAIVNIFDHF